MSNGRITQTTMPINVYATWKYVMLLCVLILGCLYALPNWFGEDPSIQISANRGANIEQSTIETVEKSLINAGFNKLDLALKDKRILVRFDSTESQLKAQDIVQAALGRDYTVALHLEPAMPEWLQSIGAHPLKQGLDLRGGIHFLMEVDVAQAVASQTRDYVDLFKNQLREERLRYRKVSVIDQKVVATFADSDTASQAQTFLDDYFRELEFQHDSGESVVTAVIPEAQRKVIADYAVEQNITTLRSRVNELGVAEPVIQRQGKNRIIVQLPGVQDSARAKKILSATASLEFYIVDDSQGYGEFNTKRVPPGKKILYDADGMPYLLKDRVILTGNHITHAAVGYDERSQPQVDISLDSKGGNQMKTASRPLANSSPKGRIAVAFIEYKEVVSFDEEGNKSVSLIKHEEIITAPTVQTTLAERFRITGQFSLEEAQNLSLLLRAGALAVPAKIVEERTVGPSLGQENIDAGIFSIVLGFVLVMVFMVIYYRSFGLIANVALLTNLVLITALMSLIPGATLTLPGMAGIVLTVGMAVDANVLIFERIREELDNGRSVQQAIHQGYDQALSTIADANITTLIAAVILFAVGTGPIKGFAVTLSLGIMTSMFTAIMGTRALVNWRYGQKNLKSIAI